MTDSKNFDVKIYDANTVNQAYNKINAVLQEADFSMSDSIWLLEQIKYDLFKQADEELEKKS